jgi:RsiW-degrading membrane proteinase PrsW (M82 family)
MIHKKDKRETVEMVLLVIMYLSVFNCLSRSDFNMAFALACYYLWDLRFDQLNTLILILINISTLVFDLIWIMTVSAAWTYEYKNKKNSNWDG